MRLNKWNVNCIHIPLNKICRFININIPELNYFDYQYKNRGGMMVINKATLYKQTHFSFNFSRSEHSTVEDADNLAQWHVDPV